MHPKEADGIANSVDPDQTDPSVQKLRLIMVSSEIVGQAFSGCCSFQGFLSFLHSMNSRLLMTSSGSEVTSYLSLVLLSPLITSLSTVAPKIVLL